MTTLQLDIQDSLFPGQDDPMIHLPPTSLGDILDHNGIFHLSVTCDEMLLANRCLGRIWSADDVRAFRPDLNIDQAWIVLQACEHRLDETRLREEAIIRDVAAELFLPPSVMKTRADNAARLLENVPLDSIEAQLVATLGDLFHLCAVQGLDRESLLATVRDEIDTEIEQTKGGRP